MMPRGGQNRTIYPARLVDNVRELYMSGLTQVEVGEIVGMTQRDVWKLMRRNDIAARPAIKRNQRGSANSSWRGGRLITPYGYVAVRIPEHHRAWSNGYVFEHIVVAEAALGRKLEWHGPGHPDSEIVHHRDGDRTNNAADNLAIVDYPSHLDLHRCADTGRNAG